MVVLSGLRAMAAAIVLFSASLLVSGAQADPVGSEKGAFDQSVMETAAMDIVAGSAGRIVRPEGAAGGMTSVAVDGVTADWYARSYVENQGHFCPADFPDSHWSLPSLCFQSCVDGFEGHLFPGIAVCARCPQGFEQVELDGDGVICR